MRFLLVAFSLALTALLPAHAADKPAADKELAALVAKVQTKLSAGEATEANLAGEIKEFDAIVANHPGEKTDAVAQVLLMKAMLYAEVLDAPAKAGPILAQIQTDFPGTKAADDAGKIVTAMKGQAEKNKVRAALKVGSPFPDFSEKDLAGNPLSISALEGKVVLVDFWATWCSPCMLEMPNVIAAYNKYHDRGFEIVGISLDEDKGALTKVLKPEKMTWPQYFDGLGWSNKLAEKYGVASIPSNYLLNEKGVIIGTNLVGEELDKAVAAAVGKK